jgi:UDP-N-acetylglucosamine 2-epimerase (non-hydrolysing)
MTSKSAKTTFVAVVGARPNFVKIAPLAAAFQAVGGLRLKLVHTGQHYDAALNDGFFKDLAIPRPDINLEVGSGTHAVQTAEVMSRFEPILDAEQPAGLIVVGDVNSTLAATLVAAKKGIPVAHVEAGLRSFDRSMPEEINRVLTDQISDLLFVTEKTAIRNLVREGVGESRIFFVGNVMIDALKGHLARAVPPATTLARSGVSGDARYALVTLHRPSNVDHPDALADLLETLSIIGRDLPIVFPLHPRTKARLATTGLERLLAGPEFAVLPPLGYLEMIGLLSKATLVLTDSGGVQEETTALGIPCLTLRENTERPITVDEGTNTVVGTDRKRILDAWADVKVSGGKRGRMPELWDGHAAERIVRILTERFPSRP